MHTAIRLLLIVNVAASFLPTPTTLLPHASPLRTAAITAIEKKEAAIDVADAQTLLASFLADGGSVVDGEIVDDDDDAVESDEEALADRRGLRAQLEHGEAQLGSGDLR